MILLGNKLHPPILADHVIERPPLFTLLERGLNSKLILMSSPAGTGKSTMLATWLKQHNRPAAWISLDESDNTLNQFLLYLVSALQTLGLGLGGGLSELLRHHQVVNAEPLLIQLTNEFAQLESKLILIFDDYHFLSDPNIHGAVEFLLTHLPPQVCLVIATRTDPPLSLSRLRVRHQLLEVRGTDLRFDVGEATRFLNGSQGLGLSSTAIARLETQTEGWIAALQLAALSLTDRPDKEAFIETFVGSHRFLVDYLVDEVLSRQPASIKTFLQRTAILERFDTSLCEAVTGWPVTTDLLGQLEAANLFLIPLDDERRWYRFHHLFGEFLRHRLKADEPDLLPELHRRASAWFEDVGWTDDAIRHAFLAGDDRLAARLANDMAAQLAVRWNSEQFTRYFQRIPVALMLLYPRLCLYYCWFLVTTNQLETFNTVLPILEKSRAHSSEPQIIDAAVIGLQAYVRFHQLDFAGAAQLCQRELDLLGSGEQGSSTAEAQLVRIGGINLMASICLYLDPRRAAALYSANLALSRQFGSSIGTVNGTVGLARANHQLGQLHQARQVLEQGLFWLVDGNTDRPRAGNVGELHARMGRLHYEWNQLGEVEACLQQAEAANELYGSALVLALELELSLHLLLARGDTVDAMSVLHRLDRLSLGVHRDDLLLKRTFEVMTMKGRLALTQNELPSDTHRSVLLDEVADWLGPRRLGGAARSGSDFGGSEILARWLLARNEPVEAAALLDRLTGEAQAEGQENKLIRFLLLRALALHRANREEEAMEALGRALNLAEPEGYCRSFMDLGPDMQTLLQRRATIRPTPYLTELLGAFPEPDASEPFVGEVPTWRKEEAFTIREIGVLRLLESGNTHKQIARDLQLSPNTVRWYMKNLYTKLGVNNRTEALNRARELKLI